MELLTEFVSFDASFAINMELLTEFRGLPRLKCPIS